MNWWDCVRKELEVSQWSNLSSFLKILEWDLTHYICVITFDRTFQVLELGEPCFGQWSVIGGILLLSPCKIPWMRWGSSMSVVSERKGICKNNLHVLSFLRILVHKMDESISYMMNLLLNLWIFWMFVSGSLIWTWYLESIRVRSFVHMLLT